MKKPRPSPAGPGVALWQQCHRTRSPDGPPLRVVVVVVRVFSRAMARDVSRAV
ncbi:MAG: hypothetical protein HY060_02425 [Proteobacteria bacterium]|nr:hypothetical protein [Pseudomonadota bacterium]